MAEQILMSPPEMRAHARTIDNYRMQIEALLTQLDNTIRDVETGWRGASQCSFLDSYQEMKSDALSHFPEILDGISTQLTSSADIMEETDHQLSQMLHS